jgi:hypothetical protein
MFKVESVGSTRHTPLDAGMCIREALRSLLAGRVFRQLTSASRSLCMLCYSEY